MKKILCLACLFSLTILTYHLEAQITCTPAFPTPDDNVTITFDATQGNKGLLNETKDVYAHTGVITDKSTAPSDWKYVKAAWTTNLPECKLTRDAANPNLYTLKFNIRQFYNVPSTDTIKKMAFVFRNSDQSNQGKTADNSDIFYAVSTSALFQSQIITPTTSSIFVNIGDVIPVNASASVAGDLFLYDNNIQVATSIGALNLSYNLKVTNGGLHKVVFKAVKGTAVDSSSFTYFVANAVQSANYPSGLQLGANFNAKGDSMTLLFQAPRKKNVFVIGSFNNYQIDEAYQMKQTLDGNTWWLAVGGLTPGNTYTYQYLVEGTMKVADPLSTLILDPNNDAGIPAETFPNLPLYPTGKTTGFISVVQPGKTPYNWKTTNFTRPAKSDLVIYELHIRDFVAKHNYQTLIDTINYLKNLGITAIELMPVSEFNGNESWGYDPVFHNALDKYYGTPDKFKEFVDLCHSKGIAVILDVVFNHVFGTSPLATLYATNGLPSADNPWLNTVAPHPFSVFDDFNHESLFTKAYVSRCISYWLSEYKIDGYRFDLAKGFTQRQCGGSDACTSAFDQSRVNIISNYNQVVQQTSPGAYTILESFVDNSEETVYVNAGMMIWGNNNYAYNQATMGYNGDNLKGVAPQARGWVTAQNQNGLIGYMESHDEERLMFKNLKYGNFNSTYNVKDLPTALRRIELASAFFYTVPGPKMLWEFGELGYDVAIDNPCRVCNKPIYWNYFSNPNRFRLYNVTRNLIDLKLSNVAFRSLSYNADDLNVSGFKHFHVSDASFNTTIFGNFTVDVGLVTPYFQHTGTWFNYMTGETLQVNDVAGTINLLPGEYRIYTDKQLKKPVAGYVKYELGVFTQDFSDKVNEFMVYPNPKSSQDNLHLGYNLREGGEVFYSITNLLGQKIVQSPKHYVTSGSNEENIKIPLLGGVYFITLNVDGATGMQKLIVE